MWIILRTNQRTRHNLMKCAFDRLQVFSILVERQSQPGEVVLRQKITQAFGSSGFGIRKELWSGSLVRRRCPDVLVHAYASDRSMITRLGDRTRVARQLRRLAVDPELSEWAKSNVEAIACRFGTWSVPSITVANDHLAQIRLAVAPAKSGFMVRLAKKVHSILLTELNVSTMTERTAHWASVPLHPLHTGARP